MQQNSVLEGVKNRLDAQITKEFARIGEDAERRAQWLIGLYSGACAGVALQPLPFADILLLTPLQVLMVQHMARAYSIPITTTRAGEILAEITAVIGLGMVAQQAVLGLYKLGLPFAGGLFTFPLVFAATWAMGQVMSRYFQYLVAEQPIDPDELKMVFKRELKAGKKKARAEKTIEER